MSLFQKSVEQKYLKQNDSKLINSKYNEFKAYFDNPLVQENIRNSKEEQFQEGFLRELFVKILGYTLNPSPNFNLTTEYKNIKDSKKADGAIIINEVVKAVIELKSTDTTDLGKVESQAFGYKNNQPECAYIITSNFEKLRFYIDNAIDYIEFNLFSLTQNDFEILYLCLAYDTIVKGIPKKIKEESISQEDAITKKLYQDYSLFKRELHQNLVNLNPQFDALTLFKKSQKLLDRFLFLFFAEDRQLLPPNSVRLVLNDWRELQERDVEIPLYARFKKYFEYLNTGYKGKRYDVFAYNGGLFKPDGILDIITIDDELLFRHTQKLADYDFASEVDVNILGHIFENSLNELDEIKAQLAGQEIDKTKTKRKKDGIFYTPKYITKYIVESTIGRLCSDKKIELQIIEEDYSTDKRRQTKTKQVLIDKLKDYRNWLLHITICDPACGSGAFLNQALDFLIKEHRYIDELQAKLFGDSLILSDIENSILENNLFGVDLNEESVEIAKLSLWLRTAQPNRKLNDLNNNIKCGNSLIDDPNIAGDKAFDWHKQFSDIFARKGFDVIIGNPPYVSANNMKFAEREFFNNQSNFKTLSGKWDLYIPFLEQSLYLLKEGGKQCFIIPFGLLNQPFGIKLRKLILEDYQIQSIVDLKDIKVFQDATIPTCIPLICKKKIDNYFVEIHHLKDYSFKAVYSIDIQKYKESDLLMFRTENLSKSLTIMDKIRSKSENSPLGTLFYVSTGAEIHGKEKRRDDGSLESGHSKFDVLSDDYIEGYKEYIEGSAIPKSKEGRYCFPTRDAYLNYQPKIMRSAKFPELFESEKIIIRGSSGASGILATFDNRKLYTPHKITIIINKSDLPTSSNEYDPQSHRNLKFLLSLLNSSLFHFYYSSVFGGFIDVYPSSLKALPIPELQLSLQYPLIDRVETMLSSNKLLNELSGKFIRSILRKCSLNDIPGNLQNWYLLSYQEFISELSKKKVKLSLSDEAEWEDYFLKESIKALELKTRIEATDKEIDLLVYKLYDLTDEEIKIIEM